MDATDAVAKGPVIALAAMDVMSGTCCGIHGYGRNMGAMEAMDAMDASYGRC